MNKDFGEAIAATGILKVHNDPEELQRELMEFFGFVGAAEIAERAGVTVGTVVKWQQRHDDFPAPLFELKMGRVWSWRDVEPWVEAQKAKRPGRPRKAG